MTEIVLFHSVLGVRPSVLSWAERLRQAGHVVHVPDLYDGATFDSYQEADGFLQDLGGYPELLRRTAASVDHLRPDLVYAGFSNGAGCATYLAAARPGALAALLMHGALPLAVVESVVDAPLAWPAATPAQLHYGRDDPLRQESSVQALSGNVLDAGASYEYFEYPVAGHLFADDGLPAEYDEAAAELMWQRAVEFLGKVGSGA